MGSWTSKSERNRDISRKVEKRDCKINRSLTQWVLGFEDWAKSIFQNSALLANWEERMEIVTFTGWQNTAMDKWLHTIAFL